jgi:ABC-type Na+ transport system ATPase subunit NatA
VCFHRVANMTGRSQREFRVNEKTVRGRQGILRFEPELSRFVGILARRFYYFSKLFRARITARNFMAQRTVIIVDDPWRGRGVFTASKL